MGRIYKVDYGEVSGGGIPDLSQMQTNGTVQQFPATVGKTYLAVYYHGGGGGNVSSGGTVVSYYQLQQSSSQYVYMAIIKATATTVVMTGSGNYVGYMQLD